MSVDRDVAQFAQKFGYRYVEYIEHTPYRRKGYFVKSRSGGGGQQNQMTKQEMNRLQALIAQCEEEARIEALEEVYRLWHEEGGLKIGLYARDMVAELKSKRKG